MHVISWKQLKEFGEHHPDAQKPLRAWRSIIEKSRFATPAELKAVFPSASFVGHHRTVFNVGGNKYRLVADVRYDLKRVYIRRMLTHEDYNDIDVSSL